jgi:alpha-amylase
MASAPVYLLMAIHCHQPVGNFDFVFDQAFRQSYHPFLETLERHPGVRLALHYSGSLLDWLVVHQPQFLPRLRRLVRSGQVELLASGYYEPILPLIPDADRQGQIAFMQETLRRRVGATASGCWLTERVWEPELPSTLARAGIRFTMVDTNQFQAAKDVLPARLWYRDQDEEDLLGCYVTDYVGETVTLFPSSKRLRYWMPFQEVDRTIEFLKQLIRDEPVAITFADDGEKFGLWPKTYEWVYEQGWLERLFSALERESSWLKTATFSDYLAQTGPSGRVYLPGGSYEEMLEWSGGSFRNFFVKYPEAQAMYQRMLRVSERLQQVRNSECGMRNVPSTTRRSKTKTHSELRTPNSELIKQAERELYKGQCNCAYWHGVFGGLYLSHLRRAVYRHLLTAEQVMDRLSGTPPALIQRDLDGDGEPEVALRSARLGVVIDPREHGAVIEVDDYARAVNVTDTLTRHRESYHHKLQEKASPSEVLAKGPVSIHDLFQPKEEGLSAYLVYDDHRRSNFLEYALSAMPSLQQIQQNTWGEYRLWMGGSYQVGALRPSSASQVAVQLVRRLGGGSVRKTFTLLQKQPVLRCRYEVEGLEIPVVGMEMNLGLWNPQWAEPLLSERLERLDLQDASLPLTLRVTIDPPATVARVPIYTVSESEEGLERTSQGLAVVCLWALAGRRTWACEIEWRLGD